jgi:hypothetical protein
MLNLRLCAMLTALSILESAWAAGPSTTAILACTKIPEEAQRLACFDREAAVLSAAPTPAVPPKLTPEQKIGLTRDQVEAMQAPAGAPPEPQIKDFTAAIKSVTGGAGNRQVFELDNGQVWRQSESKSFAAHPGDAVRISKAALGSFFMELQSNKHMATRVSRVR